MRTARIKINAESEEGVYHCISRTVNGEFLFGDEDREVLRRQIWKVADYCGVEVLSYAILSNHFHLLVRVPVKEPVDDGELLRRYERMYPQPTKYQVARLEVIKAELESNGPEAQRWRERQLRLMGDVSIFMKLLKMRYSIWYNRRHDRFGTLWSERFKSLLVETGRALQTAAAYIDLNCVRAGLAEDPKDYRFCGYAEAVAGNRTARKGIESVMGEPWGEASKGYRQILFGTGADPAHPGGLISRQAAAAVIRNGGELSLAEVLRCRIRYFTDGAVFGSHSYVSRQLNAHYLRCGAKRLAEPKPLPGIPGWTGLTIMRSCRSSAIA